MAIVSGAPKPEIEYQLKKNNAFDYFIRILGMEFKGDKFDKLEEIMESINAQEAFFCDDRLCD